MVGDFAVGKTSLTQRFVNNCFSEKYLTTIGVKIDSIVIDETKLIIWDVAGRDTMSPINANYLVGASGIILVADGTRPNTIDALASLWQMVVEKVGEVPVVVAINKNDDQSWQFSDQHQAELETRNWPAFATSAKEGENVEAMFQALKQIIESNSI